MTHRGPIAPLPPITAQPEIINQARTNVVRRLTGHAPRTDDAELRHMQEVLWDE